MRALRRGLAHTSVVLRQLLSDRTSLFFILVLPVAVIVIIGTTFGGADQLRIGVVGGGSSDVGRRIDERLRTGDRITVESYSDEPTMARALRRFALAGGIVIPPDADDRLDAGATVDVTLLSAFTDDTALQVRLAIMGVVDDVATPIGAAATASRLTGAPLSAARRVVEDTAHSSSTQIRVETRELGAGAGRELGQFARTAPQNLVLFTFINALTSATLLVQARRTGVLRRAMAAPTSLGAQMTGIAFGWYVLCLIQSALIIVIGRVAFGVDWGSPLAGLALVLLFAAVGCGAGLLTGALGGNEDRVAALTPPIGIVLAILGGCTVPLEVFSDSMLTVARFTPHYWAMDGWTSVVLRGEGIGEIGTNLGVLGGYASTLMALAVWRLRSALSSGR